MSDPTPTSWQTGLQRAQAAVSAAPAAAAAPHPLAVPPPLTGDRRIDRKLAKRWAKLQRRQMERALEANDDQFDRAAQHPLQGAVMLIAAAALGAVGLMHEATMWWLLFPAMGIGIGGARIVGAGLRRASVSAPLPVTAGQSTADPRDARVDAICDRILQELARAPALVKELIGNPEETVKTLRASCHELARRERELRALNSATDDTRLGLERDSLAARLEADADPVVKQRLAEALIALDDQRRGRLELTTAASRLEAEHLRITYSLERLYAQILRVRSSDSASADVAGASFRSSLDELGTQMTAVAEALESVHAGDFAAVGEVGSPKPSTAPRAHVGLDDGLGDTLTSAPRRASRERGG